jgi:hypothetical protein
VGSRVTTHPAPSLSSARVLTLVSVVLPITLPIAILLHRQARSGGLHRSSGRLVDRPVLFVVLIWGALCVVGFLGIVISAALGQNVA